MLPPTTAPVTAPSLPSTIPPTSAPAAAPREAFLATRPAWTGSAEYKKNETAKTAIAGATSLPSFHFPRITALSFFIFRVPADSMKRYLLLRIMMECAGAARGMSFLVAADRFGNTSPRVSLKPVRRPHRPDKLYARSQYMHGASGFKTCPFRG